MQTIHGKSAYQQAYERWFCRYEDERRRRHKRRGAILADFPGPPASPDDIARCVDAIGARRVVEVLEIHRSTLARWLSGAAVIPRPAWLVLVMLADGLLPGMSDDWREWRFHGNALVHVGTNQAFTARELAGLPYQAAHARALAFRLSELERENARLLRLGDFGAANDPIMRAV